MVASFDVAVAGGGAAGLALALAVRQASEGALSVVVCDPALKSPAPGDARALALVAGARRFLSTLGAWPAIEAEAEPIRRMEITDSGLLEPIRPALLDFGGDRDRDGPFAHMAPLATIVAALRVEAVRAGVALRPDAISAAERGPSRVRFTAGGEDLAARLLVAADGKGSPLREAAGIPFYGWEYGQTAIVATIGHSLPHEGVAVEHFLPSGPFALLPLRGDECSIVWSEESKAAKRFLALAPNDLRDEIDRRAAGRFGTIRSIRDVAGFPLSLGVARRFIDHRLALLGDAAHVMHPIAGQGLNYALRGAAALAETILDAARLGLDIGGTNALEAYETARRGDVMAILTATDGLNRLFSTDSGAVRMIRDLGLGLVERMPGLKAKLIGAAAGEAGLAPRAFRGEAI